MKVRTFFSSLLVLVLVLLVVGLGGFWQLTAQSPIRLIKRGGQPLPEAAVFVPKNTPLMASLLVRPDQLTTLWQLQSAPSQRRQTLAEIDRLRTAVLAGSGLSYEEDISPWLGSEVTFAVTTIDRDQDPSNGRQPGYLLALSCIDSEQATAALELFWRRRALAGNSLVFEQFAGSKLIYTKQLPSAIAQNSTSATQAFDNIASAVVGQQFVLLANDPTILKQALTNVQSADLNLDQDGDYRTALTELPKNRVGLVFLNLPKDLAWLGFPEQPLTTLGLGSQDDVFDRSLLSLRLDPAGVIADTALLAAGGHRFHPRTIEPSLATEIATEMIDFLPIDVPLAAIGQDFYSLWEALNRTLAVYLPDLNPLGIVTRALNVEWDADMAPSLLGWVKGNYALGMLPITAAKPLDWVLAVQRQADTAETVQKLDQLAQAQGLSVGPLQLPDQQSVMAWIRLAVNPERSRDRLQLSTAVTALHTQVKDIEVFATSLTGINQAMQSSRSSRRSPDWQAAVASFRRPHGGILYLDWPRMKPSLLKRSAWLRLADAIAEPLSQRLKSVAITSYGGDEKFQHGGIFFRLSNS